MAGMRRGRLALTVSLALGAIGWLSAHVVAYRIAAPDAHERVGLLQATGHGYLAYLPFFLALCLVLALVSLVAYGLRYRTDLAHPRVPLALLGSIPPFAFLVQEHLERFLSGGELHAALLQPAVLIGLLLQLPFALAAVFLGRLLLAVADSFGRKLCGGWHAPRVLPLALLEPVATADRPRFTALAFGVSERGPPSSFPL